MSSFISFSKPPELKTSRSGRLLIPRLKTWTGERVVVKKGGSTEIREGVFADFTSTFQPERAVIKELSSFNVSNISQIPRSPDAKFQNKAIIPLKKQAPVRMNKTNKTNKGRKQKVPEVQQLAQNVISSSSRKAKLPTPKKVLRKEKIPSVSPKKRPVIDIWGPEFQPVVLLRRLLPEEIIAMSMTECDSSPVKKANHNSRQIKVKAKRPRKKPSPKIRKITKIKSKDNIRSFSSISNKSTASVKKSLNSDTRSQSHRRPKTVKETREILCQIHNMDEPTDLGDDEAANNEEAFKQSPWPAGIKRLTAAINILKDNLGESDDNLSFRSISERESSPMSTAVSPVASLYDGTDVDENSEVEDGLLRGSPVIADPTSYQHARLVHRTVKERALLMNKRKKILRRSRTENEEESTATSSDSTANWMASGSKASCPQLYQPQVMRALEKKIKKNVKSGSPWDFSAYHKGTVLHISINSDSEEESESSFDSLDDDF